MLFAAVLQNMEQFLGRGEKRSRCWFCLADQRGREGKEGGFMEKQPVNCSACGFSRRGKKRGRRGGENSVKIPTGRRGGDGRKKNVIFFFWDDKKGRGRGGLYKLAKITEERKEGGRYATLGQCAS